MRYEHGTRQLLLRRLPGMMVGSPGVLGYRCDRYICGDALRRTAETLWVYRHRALLRVRRGDLHGELLVRPAGTIGDAVIVVKRPVQSGVRRARAAAGRAPWLPAAQCNWSR